MLHQGATTTATSSSKIANENELSQDIESSTLLQSNPPASSSSTLETSDSPPTKRANFQGNPTRCAKITCLCVMILYITVMIWATVSRFALRRPNCVSNPNSILFPEACWDDSVANGSLHLQLHPSLIGSKRLVLVSASHAKGAVSSDGNQTSLYHMPASSARDLNVFRFAYDGGAAAIRLGKATGEWGARTSDPDMTETMADSIDDVWLESLPVHTENSGWSYHLWVDASSWVLALFHVAPLLPRRPLAQIASIKLYPENCVIRLRVSSRTDSESTTTVSFFLTINIVLLSKTPALARQADHRIGYFATAFSVVGPFPKRASARQGASMIEMIHTRRKFVYYVDPSVPIKYRAAVKKGVEIWDEALTKAGHAPRSVRAVLPGDVDWPEDYDAGDSRYTSISWSVAFDVIFAYGPSLVDPRSGEILDSDILISHGWLSSWTNSRKDFWGSGASSSACEKNALTMGSIGEWRDLMMREEDEVDESEQEKNLNILLNQGITDVVMHEVGHTLGLRHNFKASTEGLSFDDLKNAELCAKQGLSASVMDYNGLNIESIKCPFQTVLGAYDFRAIEYGYTKFDESDEMTIATFDSGALRVELASSRPLVAIAESAGAFATDEDDSAHHGVDPYVAAFDLSKEPIKYYFAILSRVADRQASRADKEWKRRSELSRAVHRRVAAVVKALVKFVGGVEIDRRGRGSVKNVQNEVESQVVSALLELFVHGTFQSKRLLTTGRDATDGWLLDSTGFTCDGGSDSEEEDNASSSGGGSPPFLTESYCLGVKPVDPVAQGEEVRKSILASLLDSKRLERMASFRSARAAADLLGLVSDATWFGEGAQNLSENLQFLWISKMTALPCSSSGRVRELARYELDRVVELVQAQRNATKNGPKRASNLVMEDHQLQALATAKRC